MDWSCIVFPFFFWDIYRLYSTISNKTKTFCATWAATLFAVLPSGRAAIIKTVAKAGATDSLTCSVISICFQYATFLLILPLKPDRAIWWWTRPSNFSVPEGTDRSLNMVLSWKQYYPSMSTVGNMQAVLESRGAYRMMPLILQGNLFPLPQSLSVYNFVIHRPICMLLMLPGGSQGCRYKLCFLTTLCRRVGNCGNQQFCFLCSPVLLVDFCPAIFIPEWNWKHCSFISCCCIVVIYHFEVLKNIINSVNLKHGEETR